MIDDILQRLNGAGITAWASSDADPSRADTVPGLVQLVDPVVSGNLWPVQLPMDAPDTTGVYSLAGQGDIEVDGYRLGRVDIYVLSLRSPTFDPLRSMSQNLIERLADHTGLESWEITDAATDYEDDPRQYRAHFELQGTSLATATPALPAAYVHSVEAQASDNGLATCAIRQTVTEYIAVVLVAPEQDITALRQAVSVNVLLGLEIPGGMSPLEYVSGGAAGSSGGIIWWRELYRYQRQIRAPEPASTGDSR